MRLERLFFVLIIVHFGSSLHNGSWKVFIDNAFVTVLSLLRAAGRELGHQMYGMCWFACALRWEFFVLENISS